MVQKIYIYFHVCNMYKGKESLSFLGSQFPLPFIDKLLHVELSLTSFVIHVANLPKDISLFPSLIVNSTDRPHTSCKTLIKFIL